eukprot:2388174-Pyramimonas_sp.AAC.1
MHFSRRGYLCKQLIRAMRLPGYPDACLEGKVKDEVRYLGPYLSMSESARSEVYRRCTAARGGFASLGGAWGLG